jgi:hypothetical protein
MPVFPSRPGFICKAFTLAAMVVGEVVEVITGIFLMAVHLVEEAATAVAVVPLVAAVRITTLSFWLI